MVAAVLLMAACSSSEPDAASGADRGSADHGLEQATSASGVDEVLAVVEATPGRYVIVGCVAPDHEEEHAEDLVVVGFDLAADSPPEVTLRQVLERSQPCRQCSAKEAEDLVPESVSLVLNCLSGGTAGFGSAHVIVSPPGQAMPSVAFEVACGITRLEADGDTLMLTSAAPKQGAVHPSPRHPPIDLSWTDPGFYPERPEDSALLHHFCEVIEPTSLSYNAVERVEEHAQVVTTDIGALRILRDTVFGSSAPGDTTCSALNSAWYDNIYDADGDFRADIDPQAPESQVGVSASPIADAIGLPPPDGLSDWYYSCLDTAVTDLELAVELRHQPCARRSTTSDRPNLDSPYSATTETLSSQSVATSPPTTSPTSSRSGTANGSLPSPCRCSHQAMTASMTQ
jgi:hypothetical protein